LDAARGRRPCREGSREGPADPDRVKPGEVLSRGAPCAPAAIALSDGAKRSRCCPSPARRDNYCPLLWPSAAAAPPPRLPASPLPRPAPPLSPPAPFSRALELEREGSPPRPRHSSPPPTGPAGLFFFLPSPLRILLIPRRPLTLVCFHAF